MLPFDAVILNGPKAALPGCSYEKSISTFNVELSDVIFTGSEGVNIIEPDVLYNAKLPLQETKLNPY